MNTKQYLAVINALEKIDRTGITPELSGPIGRFFRDYARNRLDVAHLSLALKCELKLDGTLRGGRDGVATLRFLEGRKWDESLTEFGVLYHVPALCDEFLSPITLRLWSGTGAGSEGIHSVANTRLRSQGIRLQGGFLWKPPAVLLPGTATFQVTEIPDLPQWLGADYLRYVGEDAGLDPHPLSYVPLGGSLFASLRIVVGRSESAGFLSVPFATIDGTFQLRVRTHSSSTASTRALMQSQALGSWLVAHEPDSEDWLVLDACEATTEQVVLNSATWGAFLQTLSEHAVIPPPGALVKQTAANVARIAPSAGLSEQVAQGVGPRGTELATRIAEQMRFPDRRPGVKVVSGEP